MKKIDSRQLVIDFDAPEQQDGNNQVSYPSLTIRKHLVYPKTDDARTVFDGIAEALLEINTYLARFPKTVHYYIFKQLFLTRSTIGDIMARDIPDPNIVLPSRERVRQIAVAMAHSLANGQKCEFLRGVQFRSSLVEAIARLKADPQGIYVDSSVVSDQYLNQLGGIALILRMNIAEKDTVLSMLTNRFFLPYSILRDTFKLHFWATFLYLQSAVRPVGIDDILTAIPQQKRMDGVTLNPALVELTLKDYTIFEAITDADGTTQYMLRFEFLRLNEMYARIIYEKRSISLQDIFAEVRRRGVTPKSTSLSQTRKNYPWCVPMGKALWIYKEDCESFQRIQDVIKAYCEQHIRFTFDEITDYLRSRGYDMKDSSLRSYIMLHCRRKNADSNSFCLTNEVPADEEKIWMKKTCPRVSTRKVEYRSKVLNRMKRIIRGTPDGRIARRALRQALVPFLNEQNININVFYKILNSTNQLTVEECEDGTTYISLK